MLKFSLLEIITGYIMTSFSQASANQSNAQKSTGPVTEEGKAIVSNNAIKHGLFSKRLILSDEDPVEYQTLFQQLQSELAPTGVLEQTLVRTYLRFFMGARNAWCARNQHVLS